ncbi:major histocompatibility complex class I-related gene protein-like [Alligator mississippiensis]|uniref:major histocompatibility complex class I-related gene protein-like n=1 Tax=Alligator mississippiensis TaxID=8496 RepID=UPI0028776F02|nr:major histocompatibility complex class I-related gene protein-like [Alligator mississippiensis]
MSYVDNQPILHYDSDTRRQEPCGDWVQGAVGPGFWDREIRSLRVWQDGFKRNLLTLQHRYNQTGGSHTLQLTYGCELREDGSTGGHMQLGYDGGDFISYDLGTCTWVAAPTQAQVTQRSWNEEKALLQITRAYLEETCIECPWQNLPHGEAALQSSESRCHCPGQQSTPKGTPASSPVSWVVSAVSQSCGREKSQRCCGTWCPCPCGRNATVGAPLQRSVSASVTGWC